MGASHGLRPCWSEGAHRRNANGRTVSGSASGIGHALTQGMLAGLMRPLPPSSGQVNDRGLRAHGEILGGVKLATLPSKVGNRDFQVPERELFAH